MKLRMLFALAVAAFLMLVGTLSVDAQGRRGGGPPSGVPRGGGPPAGIPSGGIDRGLGTASDRSNGRSDSGLGRASENSSGRSDTGLDRARTGRNYPSDNELNRFRGIARRFDTTPEEMRERFLEANKANPDLNFGRFVAANVIADNLGQRYPNVTTEAILDRMAQGDSLGQALRMLGVGEVDVKEAPKAADRQIRESRKRP